MAVGPGRGGRLCLISPLPGPLPARSSRGEGGDRPGHVQPPVHGQTHRTRCNSTVTAVVISTDRSANFNPKTAMMNHTHEHRGPAGPSVTILLFAGSLVAWSVAAADPEPRIHQSAGTRKMAERLERITAELDPMKNQFLNRARAAQLRAQLQPLLALPPTSESVTKRFNVQAKYATELLCAGEPESAIESLKELERLLIGGNAYAAEPRALIQTLLATCYLRLGEQENCQAHHNIDSCLLPIRGDGDHNEQRGSRGAMQVLTKTLAESPNDLRARWLLNLACMTVGEYPGKVPAQWLIPPAVFQSDYDIQHFSDVAPALDLDVDALAGGVVLDDFDGDGNLDLLVSSMGVRDQIRFFHNNGDGTFTERTRESGLAGELGGL